MATRGAPGDPPRGPFGVEGRFWDENAHSCDVFLGSLFGAFGLKIVKKTLWKPRGKTLCARGCTRSLRGPPATMKTMVSCERNACSQISICTPQMTRNDHQWASFWDPFGRFWVPLVDFFGEKKTIEKRVTQGIPRNLGNGGWGALKQSYVPRPTDPLDTL